MPENKSSSPSETPTRQHYDDIARRPPKIMEFIGDSVCKAFAEGQGASLEILLHEYKTRIVYLDQNDPNNWFQLSQLHAAIDHLCSLNQKK